MWRAILMLVLLVAACGPSEIARGARTEVEAHLRPREEIPEGEYVPQPHEVSDERPWASAFVNWSLAKADIRGSNDPRALSWLEWGTPLDRPARGAIAVLDYGNGRGHVGFVVGRYNGMIVLLGGDQGNAVSTTAFAADDVTAYRFPPGPPPRPRAYDLPTVTPEKDEGDESPPHPEGTNRAAAPIGPDSIRSIEDYSLAGQQTLRIQARADDRIRFHLRAGPCQRSVTGTAYAIYASDVQIDKEAGVGYPTQEYFYWADSEGKRGISIRLSVAGPQRAKVIEWGYETQCPYSKRVMHGAARPPSVNGIR